MGAALAACAVVVLVVVRRPAPGADPLVAEGVADHLRVVARDRPVDIENGGPHQVRPWFTGRLDFALPSVFGGDDEYTLTGGAVGYYLDRKSAVLVYKRGLHVASLSVFPAAGLAFPAPGQDAGGVAGGGPTGARVSGGALAARPAGLRAGVGPDRRRDPGPGGADRARPLIPRNRYRRALRRSRVRRLHMTTRSKLFRFTDWVLNPPLDGPAATALMRVMAGGVFLSEGILKFVYTNQGVGRFTKLGFPFPHFTASFVGGLEIVGGCLMIAGLLTRAAAIPFVIEMVVAILSTKVSLVPRDVAAAAAAVAAAGGNLGRAAREPVGLGAAADVAVPHRGRAGALVAGRPAAPSRPPPVVAPAATMTTTSGR